MQDRQSQQSQQNGKPSDQQKDEQAERQGGEDQQPGESSGQESSSPMEDSRIVPGQRPAPVRLTTVHDSDESGDWATLPPRRREEIQKILRQKIAARYRRLVSDYHERLTDEGSD